MVNNFFLSLWGKGYFDEIQLWLNNGGYMQGYFNYRYGWTLLCSFLAFIALGYGEEDTALTGV
jgi:hypothetical protein